MEWLGYIVRFFPDILMKIRTQNFGVGFAAGVMFSLWLVV